MPHYLSLTLFNELIVELLLFVELELVLVDRLLGNLLGVKDVPLLDLGHVVLHTI